MKLASKAALLSAAALVAVAIAPAAQAPAYAAELTAAAARMQGAQPTDISARRKHSKHYSYRHYQYSDGWHGLTYAQRGDPTAGPNSLYNYYRRNNICAIDEGYGRATRCD